MKALTIWQPWASLKACGAKEFETRGWATKYRGPIAIHAAKISYSPYACELPSGFADAAINILWPGVTDPCAKTDNWDELPLGAIIATAVLVECWEIHGAHGRGTSSRDVFIDKYNPNDPNNITMISPEEYILGDFTPGRYAWEFADMKLLAEPVPAKGKQGLWNWTPPKGELQYANIVF